MNAGAADQVDPPAVERPVWRLAIDLGTTYTSATIQRDGETELLMVDGQPRIPSTVAVDDDGSLVAGIGAERVLARAPERAERNPKRRIGDEFFLLGDQQVSTVDALAAVFTVVARQARDRFDGAPPHELVLTHPARWGSVRLGRLVEAATRADLPDPLLVPEPVAAAWAAAATASLGADETAAIYDLGGGTLDVAIVRSVDGGFDLIGPPGGSDRIGGEMFDERLFTYLGERLAVSAPAAWEQLRFSTDRTWRRASHDFREQVRAAKEALSTRSEDTLYLGAPVDHEIRLTRDELVAVLDTDVTASVTELEATAARAGLAPGQLGRVFLVGGGSRMPLVAQRIGDWYGEVPTTWGDPKSVVAIGALAAAEISGRRLAGVLPTAEMPVAAVAAATAATTGGEALRSEPEPSVVMGGGRRRRTVAMVGLVAAVAAVSIAWALLRSGGDPPAVDAIGTTTSGAEVAASTTSTSSTSSTSTTSSTTSTSSTSSTSSTTSTSPTSSTSIPATTSVPDDGGSTGGTSSGGGSTGGTTTETTTATTVAAPPPATTTTTTTRPPTTTTTTTAPPSDPTVPNVIGMDFTNAQQTILNAGYNPTKRTVTCTGGQPSSQVIDYSPKGEQPLGTTVFLDTCI